MTNVNNNECLPKNFITIFLDTDKKNQQKSEIVHR